MAQISLVDALIDAGAHLIGTLHGTEFEPESAFWLYRPESDDWVLRLGSSAVPTRGLHEGYTRIGEMLRTGDFQPLRLDDVVLSGNDDPLLQQLRLAVKAGPALDQPLRFSRNRVGNAFIEDALIYRLQDSRIQQPT